MFSSVKHETKIELGQEVLIEGALLGLPPWGLKKARSSSLPLTWRYDAVDVLGAGHAGGDGCPRTHQCSTHTLFSSQLSPTPRSALWSLTGWRVCVPSCRVPHRPNWPAPPCPSLSRDPMECPKPTTIAICTRKYTVWLVSLFAFKTLKNCHPTVNLWWHHGGLKC